MFFEKNFFVYLFCFGLDFLIICLGERLVWIILNHMFRSRRETCRFVLIPQFDSSNFIDFFEGGACIKCPQFCRVALCMYSSSEGSLQSQPRLWVIKTWQRLNLSQLPAPEMPKAPEGWEKRARAQLKNSVAGQMKTLQQLKTISCYFFAVL